MGPGKKENATKLVISKAETVSQSAGATDLDIRNNSEPPPPAPNRTSQTTAMSRSGDSIRMLLMCGQSTDTAHGPRVARCGVISRVSQQLWELVYRTSTLLWPALEVGKGLGFKEQDPKQQTKFLLGAAAAGGMACH
ncbi:hypothetical protein AXG93_246s1050 [Marchantia polymorpha subsp. ruderalis]|uniref:Uncharacterized protein n=1 Tax=Marchantia polymorpha subsp. ruderalis TaxID=1480154 RepID=A0A176WB31_MARPO|nr:hypothetical protein AXG93_246s1050 [Marchantia polymorpha subsp. ruderalis]